MFELIGKNAHAMALVDRQSSRPLAPVAGIAEISAKSAILAVC
jgi:hypothetical protein